MTHSHGIYDIYDIYIIQVKTDHDFVLQEPW